MLADAVCCNMSPDVATCYNIVQDVTRCYNMLPDVITCDMRSTICYNIYKVLQHVTIIYKTKMRATTKARRAQRSA